MLGLASGTHQGTAFERVLEPRIVTADDIPEGITRRYRQLAALARSQDKRPACSSLRVSNRPRAALKKSVGWLLKLNTREWDTQACTVGTVGGVGEGSVLALIVEWRALTAAGRMTSSKGLARTLCAAPPVGTIATSSLYGPLAVMLYL